MMPGKQYPVETTAGYSYRDTGARSLGGIIGAQSVSLLSAGRFLTALSAIWLSLASLTVVLALTFERSAFNSSILAGDQFLRARWGLVCFELLLASAAVLIVGGPLTLIYAGLEARRESNHISVRVGRILLQAVLFSLICLYISSWAAFWSWGHFVDLVSVRYWLETPVLLSKHVVQIDGWLLIIVPLVAVLVTAAANLWLGWALLRSNRTVKVLPLLGVVLLGASYWSSKAGADFDRLRVSVVDQEYGASVALSDHLKLLREERAGPFSRLLADLRQNHRLAINQSAAEGVTARPKVSMAQYLESVANGQPSTPNVIIVVIESLRADQLRAYGAAIEPRLFMTAA